jgi:hypothetical protein
VDGSCEHGNEPSGFIKCWEVLEQLHNWRLLKEGSAPRVSDTVTSDVRVNYEKCKRHCCESLVSREGSEVVLLRQKNYRQRECLYTWPLGCA